MLEDAAHLSGRDTLLLNESADEVEYPELRRCRRINRQQARDIGRSGPISGRQNCRHLTVGKPKLSDLRDYLGRSEGPEEPEWSGLPKGPE